MEAKTFDDLLTMGQVKKAVKLGTHEVIMHTLSSLEYSKVTEKLNMPEITDAKSYELLQRYTLVHSIESIDGQPITEPEKEKLLSMGQLGLSNLLYTEYVGMLGDQSKALEDAKKNS